MNQNTVDDRLLEEFLSNLGVSDEQANIYSTLVKHGTITKLELSRKSNIKRTTVYRLIEAMREAGIVEEVTDEHRKLVQSVPPDRLKQLVKQKEDQARQVSKLFPQVQQYLNQQINSRQPDTKVLFYKGREGIRQINWNVLRASKEVVGYTYLSFSSAVGNKFAHQLYEEMVDKNINLRDIYSDRYVESMGGVENAVKPVSSNIGWQRIARSRYLKKEVLDINYQSDIYNDVVSFYSWYDEEIFGVEIHNEKVAKMQKQIFEILWKMATPEKELIKKIKK